MLQCDMGTQHDEQWSLQACPLMSSLLNECIPSRCLMLSGLGDLSLAGSSSLHRPLANRSFAKDTPSDQIAGAASCRDHWQKPHGLLAFSDVTRETTRQISELIPYMHATP